MKKFAWNGIIRKAMINPAEIYLQKDRWKLLLLGMAVMIGVGSLLYTHQLVYRLSVEERNKVELWAEATRRVADPSSGNQLDFLFRIIETNNTVPVILSDENDSIIFSRNLNVLHAKDPDYLKKQLFLMKRRHEPIIIKLTESKRNYIYYNNSTLIQKLTFYPYIQLFLIIIFVTVSYLAFHASRSSEQNKVWLGLSRETAHQLGTPTSSLMAWTELLKEKDEVRAIVNELEKDVQRLNTITERFSKIGSPPVLEWIDLIFVMKDAVQYMENRIPKTVKLTLNFIYEPLFIKMNAHLFNWVIENLIKNALDAIKNQGEITLNINVVQKEIIIDVHDNGSGIHGRDFRRVFRPGYTTKKRGWGLGLSLTKRIIENYHGGKIFVLQSTFQTGTTFRIKLPREMN